MKLLQGSMGFKLNVAFPIMKQLLLNFFFSCFLVMLLDSRVHAKIFRLKISRHIQSSFGFLNVRY